MSPSLSFKRKEETLLEKIPESDIMKARLPVRELMTLKTLYSSMEASKNQHMALVQDFKCKNQVMFRAQVNMNPKSKYILKSEALWHEICTAR
jgi:hypothetical protein